MGLQQISPIGVEELIDTSSVTGWDVLWGVLTVVAGFAGARLVRAATKRAMSKVTQLPDNLVNLITKVAGWAVIIIAILLALPFVGIDTGPMVIVFLLIAALAALSGRVLLENYGAGVILQGEATFEPGDQIVTNDCVGTVLEVSSRAVKIEAIDGRHFVIPNNSVLAGPVVNLTARTERRSELVVGLQYGTDLDAAREILVAAAQDAAGVVTEPPVEVFVSRFGDSSIDFIVWYWHASDIRAGHDATDSVARSIDRACRQHGLKIAFPQRTMWWGEEPPPRS
ncbi:MAG: mechanosensitive ion channel [bacterium]|nr:mechanosensitive ion channel [bacterium]